MSFDLSSFDPRSALPQDHPAGTLVGRVWVPGDGPCVAVLRDGVLFDVTAQAPTMSQLLNRPDRWEIIGGAPEGRRIGAVEEVLANSLTAGRDDSKPHLLAPCDLQAIRGCGVTFIRSMLERVIEERAGGDATQAERLRAGMAEAVGAEIARVRPGSPEAARLKAELQRQGLWSQYLEVAIGPDAELFTKAQPMAAVGFGSDLGIHPDSTWNNSEPEIVLVVDAGGSIVGATLGNDVNLRDFEGRSALLLGKSKDNNGSCVIGPFIRLFDGSFTLDDLRNGEISYSVSGADGFTLSDRGSLGDMARDFEELVQQTTNRTRQHPDGLMLFTGTTFAPTMDRGEAGAGFTHHQDDIVAIHMPKLGTLVNRVGSSDAIAPWTFGIAALMQSLFRRGFV